MKLSEKEITIPAPKSGTGILEHLKASLSFHLRDDEIPIRLVISRSDQQHYKCEIGILTDAPSNVAKRIAPLFEYGSRGAENTSAFNAVLLVPTGISAEIGGHAGDATAVARMMAESCDALVLHPNVVNASDINEMPENTLYVEGSIITRMLMGAVGLERVRANRVAVVIDDHPDAHFSEAAINSVSAARAIYGMSCPQVIKLDPSLQMSADYSKTGRAAGRVDGIEHCLNALQEIDGQFDAVAISSVIDVPKSYHLDYFRREGEMVNPWGGVEAMLTHTISSILNVPTAHSPMFESKEIENLEVGIVEPRMSAEAVSVSFLQCILKGLRKSPRIVTDQELISRADIFSAKDVSCLVIPDGCLGLPTLAALEQGIPTIAVRENRNLMKNDLSELPWRDGQFFVVENYLEAVGVMNALKAGVTIESVRRPIPSTKVRTAGSDTIDVPDRKIVGSEPE